MSTQQDPMTKRGGRRPGAGRPTKQRDPNNDPETYATHKKSCLVYDWVCSYLAKLKEDDLSLISKLRPRVEEFLPQLETELVALGAPCPKAVNPNDEQMKGDLSAILDSYNGERGDGVRRVAGWWVSRVFGRKDGWFRRHVLQGPYAPPKATQPITQLPPAFLPPMIEPDPLTYFREHLLKASGPDPAIATRRFARAWNQRMRDPRYVSWRRGALVWKKKEQLGFCVGCLYAANEAGKKLAAACQNPLARCDQEKAKNGSISALCERHKVESSTTLCTEHAKELGSGRAFFCEECGEQLGELDVRYCPSRDCQRRSEARRHGRVLKSH
jgi:hypothetical protein